jgi:hypothetical protein
VESKLIYCLVYVAGLATSLVVGELLRFAFRRASYRAASTLLGRAVLRRTRSKGYSIVERLDSRWRMTLGGISTPWVVIGIGPYNNTHIECYYHPGGHELPEELRQSYENLAADLQQRKLAGEDVPYNSDIFKLAKFHVSSRTDNLEEPKLILHFAPTTYYEMLATDQRLDIPITSRGVTMTTRERYVMSNDLRSSPVAEIASFWSIGLSIITADGYILIAERGATAVDRDAFGPAVAEGVSRAKDSTALGAPDNFRAACRGMEEELGIPLQSDELTWISFGANSAVCEYALIGCVRSAFSLDEIIRRRSFWAKDAWETRTLHSVDFNPQAVAEFCGDPSRRFTPFGLAAIVFTLMHEFGFRDTELAFKKVRVHSSQDLPSYL